MKNIGLFALFLLLLSACGQQSPAVPQQEELDIETPVVAQPAQEEHEDNTTILAQVGSEKITRAQLDRILQTLDKEDQDFVKTSVGEHNFLQLLIREKLATLDAKEKSLDKDELYLNALEDKRQQLIDIYKDYADQLLLHMWDEYNIAQGHIQVTDEEIAAYYKKYPYEMTIKQIILDDAQTADTVWRELKRNKSRWKEFERKYSIAPAHSHGKQFSFMPGEFIPELEVIAANTSTGGMQGFVKTAQGFHIIMKVGERRLSLKDASSRIRTILENQKSDAILENLQNKYKVIIYEQND